MADHDRTTEPDRTIDGARTIDRTPTPDRRRTADERLADHDRIGRLAEELLPELASRLAAGNLGEIEIREDGWRLRVRRPAGVAASSTRRSGERARAGAGHTGHGAATAAGSSGSHGAGERSVGGSAATAAHGVGVGVGVGEGAASHDGSGPGSTAGAGAGAGAGSAGASAHAPDAAAGSTPRDQHRIVATSPAVGIFHVRPELHAGSRVRSGERIAMVDLLGVPQDVVAPEDGVVVETLADNGDGVEYGQELMIIELVGRFGPARAAHDAPESPDATADAPDSNGSSPAASEPA